MGKVQISEFDPVKGRAYLVDSTFSYAENLAGHRGDSRRRLLEAHSRRAIDELGQKAPAGEIGTPYNGGPGQQDGTDLLGRDGTENRLRRSSRIEYDALASQQFGGSAQEA